MKSHPREYDRCHINSNTVTEQSSPNPNNESKLKLENTPTSDNNTKIKNNYQYFSDSELCKMPSGKYFVFFLSICLIFFFSFNFFFFTIFIVPTMSVLLQCYESICVITTILFSFKTK